LVMDDLNTKIEAQQQQLIEQQPKVELAEALYVTESSMGLRDFCKSQGIKEKKFVLRLLEDKVLYRDQSDGTPRAFAPFSEYFNYRHDIINGYPRPRCYITAQGMEWLVSRYLK